MKTYYILWFFLIWSVAGFSQEVYLSDLIQKAKDHSPHTSSFALIQEATANELNQLNGAYLPQASLGGSATWQSDVTSIPIEMPGFSITPPPNDQYKVTLDFSQNLYDGGMIKSRKNLAQANNAVSQQSVVVNLLKVEEQVSHLFFGVLLANKQLENTNIGIQNLQAKIKDTKALVKNGLAIKGNLLSLEVGLLELEQKATTIQKRRESAMESLSLLSGTLLDKPKSLTTTKTQMVVLDKNTRPELALISLQSETLKASKSLLLSKYKPKLSLFGQGGYGRPGLNFLSPNFDTFFIGGVQMKVPLSQLYNGGKSLDKQQIQIKQKQLAMQKENFILMTDVKKASQIKEIETLQAMLIQDEKLIPLREKILKTADAQLNNGIITPTQYLKESNQLLLTREKKLLHEVQLLQAEQNLKTLLGQ